MSTIALVKVGSIAFERKIGFYVFIPSLFQFEQDIYLKLVRAAHGQKTENTELAREDAY